MHSVHPVACEVKATETATRGLPRNPADGPAPRRSACAGLVLYPGGQPPSFGDSTPETLGVWDRLGCCCLRVLCLSLKVSAVLPLHSWRRNGASFCSAAGSCVSSSASAVASVSAAVRDRAAKSPLSPLCPMHHCVHSGSRPSAALA